MLNIIKPLLAASCAAAFLASCGGGTNAGTSVFDQNGGTTTAQAADLLVVADSAQLSDTPSASANVTVTAVDASRNTVAGVPVTVAVDSGGVVTVSDTKTDSTGKITAVVTSGTDRSNRLITITANSGTISKSTQVQVTGAKVTGTMVPAVLNPGDSGEVRFRVVDQAGNAMTGLSVSISAPGIQSDTATGTTDANGEYVYSYTAPSASGNYQVSATVAGVSDIETVQVQAVSSIPNVTTTITSASVSASPSVVGVNPAGSTSNRSEIRALFLGANNTPISNVRVKFDLNGDPNSIGGSFTTGSSILYSDANGVVTTAYVPADRDSPTNGVTVRACYGTSDTDPNLTSCNTFATVTLTVTNSPLSVSIGTNNQISDTDSGLSYVKQYIVSVVDAAGNAKSDVNLSVSVDLPQYRKGAYGWNGTAWVKAGGSESDGSTKYCPNEDTNRNGVLESGEDTNGNGRLDPGKSDVSVSLLSTKTGSDGTAILQLQYAKSFGSWVDAWITVTASGVSGTEGRATYVVAPVPVAASELKSQDTAPSFQISPYGVQPSCSNPN